MHVFSALLSRGSLIVFKALTSSLFESSSSGSPSAPIHMWLQKHGRLLKHFSQVGTGNKVDKERVTAS